MKNSDLAALGARLKRLNPNRHRKQGVELQAEADQRAKESVNMLMEAWSAAFRSSNRDRALAELLASTSYRNGYIAACMDILRDKM